MRHAAQLVAILALLSQTYAAEPKPVGVSPEYRSLKVILDQKRPDRSLLVEYPTEITLVEKKEVAFSLTVVNLIKEDVFLVVEKTDFKHLGFNGEIDRGDVLVRCFGGSVCSSDEGLMRRLHSCSYDKAGKPRPCGCCLGRIGVRLHPESFDTKGLLSAEGTVDVPIHGYFRTNGEAFSTSVAIPVRVVKREKQGITRPTTDGR